MSFDPHHRELCSDDACIGVIGPDGRCKECGLPGPSTTRDPRHQGMNLDAEGGGDGPDSAGDRPDFADRQLCPDGACIGVIGPDGRCKECGRPGSARDDAGDADASGRPASQPAPAIARAVADVAGSGSDGDDDDFSRRELCPDGACIGVIGSDGRCKECGAARASA